MLSVSHRYWLDHARVHWRISTPVAKAAAKRGSALSEQARRLTAAGELVAGTEGSVELVQEFVTERLGFRQQLFAGRQSRGSVSEAAGDSGICVSRRSALASVSCTVLDSM